LTAHSSWRTVLSKVSEFAKRLLRWQFVTLQGLKVDVLPRHFYSEIPDIRRLRQTTEWRREYPLHGVLGRDSDEQLEFAKNVAGAAPLASIGAEVYRTACEENGAPGFGPIEAQFLYAFILAHRPSTIVQIGAGVSTSVILQAAKAGGYRPRIVCIDPFPTTYLKRCAAEAKIELRAVPVEQLPASTVSELGPKDLLFIDSTHTLGPAGEVTRLILEWLPLLAKGAYAHFHDIQFPYDYPVNILSDELFFQHETPLLMAFLSMNPSFRVLCSLAMLHHKRQSDLLTLFQNYTPRPFKDGVEAGPGFFPSSIYLERIQ
jgi:hypothetical protein